MVIFSVRGFSNDIFTAYGKYCKSRQCVCWSYVSCNPVGKVPVTSVLALLKWFILSGITGVETQLDNYTQWDLSHMHALVRTCMYYSGISIHNPSSHNIHGAVQCQALFVRQVHSLRVNKIISQINASSRFFKRKCVLTYVPLLNLFWFAWSQPLPGHFGTQKSSSGC